MDKKIIVLRGIDAAAIAAGLPLVPLVTKLFEEVSDSNIAELIEVSEAQALDKGFAFRNLRNGLMSINNFLNFEIEESRRLRQLYKSAEDFEKAYTDFKVRALYRHYSVRAACFASGAHLLLNHYGIAEEWLQTAIKDNKCYSPALSEKELQAFVKEVAEMKLHVAGS